jgi:hypothetical protein
MDISPDVDGCSETPAAARFKRYKGALKSFIVFPAPILKSSDLRRAGILHDVDATELVHLLQIPKQGANIKPNLVAKPLHCSFEYIHTLGCRGYVFSCRETPDGMRERADAERSQRACLCVSRLGDTGRQARES